MSRFSLRKVAAAGLGAALIGSGLTVGIGAGVAGAAPACAQSQSVTEKWAGSFGTPYTLAKEVVGDGTAAAGHYVTYQTKVSGSSAVVNEMRDFPPAGFQLANARVHYSGLAGGWTDVTDSAIVGTDSVVVKGTWSTAVGAVTTLETTYRVPANLKKGDVLDSGAGTNIALASGSWNIAPMGVCVTIRDANLVESGTGSLEDMGLGSVNAGSSQIFGSVTDPQGSMSNVIGGILGNMFGNMS